MKILVVGAGPTGLTMASELSRHGVSCKIIDSAAAPTTQSRALGIHARTLEYFELMGIINQFLDRGAVMRGVNMYDNDKQILKLSLRELDTPYPFVLSLPQSETEEILGAHLASYGVQVERENTLVDLVKGDKALGVVIQAADGTLATEKFDWVIGCDGAHSAVRHQLHASFEGSKYAEVFALIDTELECPSLSRDEMHMFTTKDGLLAVFPMKGNRARIIADLTTKEQAKGQQVATDATTKLPAPTLEEMQTIAAKRGPKDMSFKSAHWLSAFAIHRRQVTSYRHGRVFLAGDAAHVHSPAGGQGMNTGIQDAINLAWKLALVCKGEAKESVLDSYNHERHEVGAAVLKLTDFLTRVNVLRNPVAQAVRNTLAPLVAGQDVVQQRMAKEVAELSFNYRKSPLVAEHKVSLVQTQPVGKSSTEKVETGEWFAFESGPQPGDRAPDANLVDAATGQPISLFEVFRGTQFHLLLLMGERANSSGARTLIEIANFVTDEYGAHIKPHLIAPHLGGGSDLGWTGSKLLDPEVSLHHKYGGGSECLYLIRPDTYVGFRSLPADKVALNEYLERIFV